MKNPLILLFWALSFGIWAQAPQHIPYQAVIRNTDGTIMSSMLVTITFKIHDVAATGEVVYEETHAVTSNSQGLVSMNVGSGTVVTGAFDNINWGGGNKFLHVLMNAGNGNIDLGTQQMMSVPYALYAEDVNVRVSATGDSLFIGDQVSIVPGVSAANPVSMSNYGSALLPGNTTCQSEYISVTGCGGQDSLLYHDRYYDLVEIGGQCWFAENLATDKYSNGDLISTGLTNTEWTNTTSGAYAIYDNNLANDVIYGKLYNWYTTADTRGVCPTGWHVPSSCEWDYMQVVFEPGTTGQSDCFCGNDLISAELWPVPNSATNVSGLSIIPSGQYFMGSYFDEINISAYLWTSTTTNNFGLGRDLLFEGDILGKNEHLKIWGFALRCIRD